MKIKVGIFFGGPSREREISFAGGRTVYDNLDKSLFEPIPIFVDSFRNFILLDWAFIYKGSIRDFYPEVTDFGASPFQIYAESLGQLTEAQQKTEANKIGQLIPRTALAQHIDMAFLALHGEYGEDGTLQAELAELGIAYTGSGVAASQIGIDKGLQKELMGQHDFARPEVRVLHREEWLRGNPADVYERAATELGFPLVIRPAKQGSSIGVSIINETGGLAVFEQAVNAAFFREYIPMNEWADRSEEERIAYLKQIADLREGVGFPLQLQLGDQQQTFFHPETLLAYLDQQTERAEHHSQIFVLEGQHSESTVILESFIQGKEFSCIVLRTETGGAIALPPTEIIKGSEVFDYRSKYLPGLSRKQTPIELPEAQIENIRRECERLFQQLGFQVYARIDGFFSPDGTIYLNDPNTTSGMLPSSFFFHQAAEIGLNPSQFLSLVIRLSLWERAKEAPDNTRWQQLGESLDTALAARSHREEQRKAIAVILGGGGAERHISVESGRNVYEKLAGSEKYQPAPIFLTPEAEDFALYLLPINLLLKDNADDIRDKILHWKEHPLLQNIRQECAAITHKYAGTDVVFSPQKLDFDQLAQRFDGVFIALHGRPGEDGQIQMLLEARNLPYNGSGIQSSSLTIDKYRSLQALRRAGLPVTSQLLQSRRTYDASATEFMERVEEKIGYPCVAKPVDDGCSAAVKVIRNREELEAFCQLMFGYAGEAEGDLRRKLKLKPKEEFPCKDEILFEGLVTSQGADRFLEITGGILTHYSDKGEVIYQNFEPSETLSSGDILSLEEKFLAGEGQNITPARLASPGHDYAFVASRVKADLERTARILGVEGYCRIDAFVRVYDADNKVETLVIEVNSLPGMTPATAIFHQAALVGYKPYEFIDQILNFGFAREAKRHAPALQQTEEVAVTLAPAAVEPISEIDNTTGFVTEAPTESSSAGSPYPPKNTDIMDRRISQTDWKTSLQRWWQGVVGFFSSTYILKNVAVMLAFIAMLFFATQLFLSVYTQHGESVQVHNYVGMSLDDAMQKASSRGFRLEVIDSNYYPDLPKMQVIQQDPAPLARVKESRTIYLSINGSTPKEMRLPLLRSAGYEYNAYCRKLKALMINCEIREEKYDPISESNTVEYFYFGDRKITDEDLENGLDVPQGAVLEFVITVRQTNQAQVPNLVCKKYDAAYFLINGARLIVGEVKGGVTNRSDGYVVRQEPPFEPGKLLKVGTPITLHLSYNKPNSCPEEAPELAPIEEPDTDSESEIIGPDTSTEPSDTTGGGR